MNDDFYKEIVRIFILFIMLVAMLAFIAARSNDSSSVALASSFRFEGIGSTNFSGRIIVDTDTGVMYWVSDGIYNAGDLTPLLNADGTPRLYQGGR